MIKRTDLWFQIVRFVLILAIICLSFIFVKTAAVLFSLYAIFWAAICIKRNVNESMAWTLVAIGSMVPVLPTKHPVLTVMEYLLPMIGGVTIWRINRETLSHARHK